MSRIDNCVKHRDAGDGGWVYEHHQSPGTLALQVHQSIAHRTDRAFVITNKALFSCVGGSEGSTDLVMEFKSQ